VMHTLFAAVGLSALLMTSALAFEIVKYAGVAYLVYLGLRSLFEKTEALSLPSTRRLSPAVAFRQAVLAELLNPKTALFFLAFLPQFVHPERGPAVIQFAVLGLIFVAAGAAYTAIIALAAGSFGQWLARHRRIGRWQGKIVGGVYLGLGLRLALEER
jgi:threonine/homoserine/homoserine lactone efflux protein